MCHIVFFPRMPTVKGFDFLVNSFWPEVEQRLELDLPLIYAPGNPDMFYQVCEEEICIYSQDWDVGLKSHCHNSDNSVILYGEYNEI